MEILRELRKAAADKVDAHNSSAPLGVDDILKENTLYWKAADEIERLRAALGEIASGLSVRHPFDIAKEALQLQE